MERRKAMFLQLTAVLLLLSLAASAPGFEENKNSLSEIDLDEFFERARKLLKEIYHDDKTAPQTDKTQRGPPGMDKTVRESEDEDTEMKKKIQDALGKKEDDEGISEDRRRAASYIEKSDGEHHKKSNFKPNPDENEIEQIVQGIQREMSERSTPDEIVHAVAQALAKTGRPLGDDVTLDVNGRSLLRGVSKNKRLAYTGDLSDRWQDGIIVYDFNSDSRVSAQSEANVRLAMQYMESISCLTFVEYYDGYKDDYGLTHDSVIVYGDYGGCWSYVGPINERQQVSPCGEYGISTPLHEILHALAAWHEQSRTDRDQWIEVLPHVGSNVNYDKMWTEDRVPYDYGSVMQYGLGSESEPVMNVFDRKMEFLVGRRFNALSHLDIESTNINYRCIERKCPTFSIDCKNEGFPAYINNQCQCRCPHGFMGEDCSQLFKPADESTEWPSGEYATLRPEVGCPSGFVPGDRPMNTAWYSFWSPENHWPAGTRGNRYTNYPFCTTDGPISSSYKWPAGSYCIYRKGGSCPDGFAMGSVQFDEEWNTAESVSGSVPDGVYDNNTLLYYCCREDAPTSIPIKLPLTTPFYLLRDIVVGACQTVEGAAVVEEYVSSKVAGEGIADIVRPNSMHPYYFDEYSTLLSYQCYYIPQNFDCGGIWSLNSTAREVTLTSPNYPSPYSSNLECFYSVTSPEGTLLKIEVNDLDLEAVDDECKDDLEIRHNHISQPHERYCGDYYRGIFLTNYNSTLLVLRSDESETANKGFSIKVSIVYESELLYNVTDRGLTYHGDVNYTQSHEMCQSWTDAAEAGCSVSPWEGTIGIGFDNKCRNPNGAEQPWCYINLSTCDTDYCDVSGLTTCFDAVADCSYLIANVFDYCYDYSEAFKDCHKSCGFCGFEVSQPVHCPAPPTIEHAVLIDGESRHYNNGESVLYQCREGTGFQTRTCLTDGTWSGTDRMCGSCPSGWAGRGNNCYGYFSQPETYSSAQSFCAGIDASLVSFSDAEEEAFVSNFANDRYWIGLNDLDIEGTFVWADGSGYGGYTNWEANQPGQEWYQDCVYVQSNSRTWVATYSEWARPFVCESSLGDLCFDARSDCGQVLEDFPDMCSRSTFASTYCRATCGQCPDTSTALPDTEGTTQSTPDDSTTSKQTSKTTPTEQPQFSTEGTTQSTKEEAPQSTASVTTESSVTPTCREGYSFFDGSCYTVVTIRKNFANALSFCNGTGGFLVSISSQEELEFVKSLLPDDVDDVAIGLNDTEEEGRYVYTENGEEAKFTAWADGQPKTRNNFDCVYLDSGFDYAYKTLKCRVKTAFVCEYRPQSNVQYVGALPVNSSDSYVDFSIKKRLFIHRPLEALSGGRLVGFTMYAAKRGDVILAVLRPTDAANPAIDEVSVVDYVAVSASKAGTMMYVELDAEVPVESGDVIGIYFPRRNPISFRESNCEKGSVLGAFKPDLEKEISVDDQRFCRDYFVEAVMNTGPSKRTVATAQDLLKKRQELQVLVKLYELTEELELLEG